MMNYSNLIRQTLFVVALFLILLCASAYSQTTAFTYQGRLADAAGPLSGHYDFEFKLYDASGNHLPVGSPITVPKIDVLVTDGVFSVELDFGACPTCFNGENRFLDISVRPTGGGAYTPLSPRQPVTSNPYAIKSKNATSADGLSLTCVSCVTSSQIASVSGSAVTGTIPVASVPPNSGNYIQNQNASPQAGNFNISGNGIVGGSLSVGTITSGIRMDVAGRSRFRQDIGYSATTNTAGFWLFQNASGQDRAFVGMRDDNGVGFFGNNGGGWSLVMNTQTGNVGIGTDAPTAKLDVAGNVKVNGTVDATAFSGNGSGLTNLNGANITSGTVTSTQLSPESVPNSSAFKLLGSLRWDLLKPQANFSVGNNPHGVAFDGVNIWVANNGSVTKLRASDGTNLGTFAVGTNPNGVAFDGANIWVANTGSNNVTKLRASDGANLGSFTVGTAPFGVAFDGANIWIANSGSDNVTKLRASDGACVGTCTFSVGPNPNGVAFDGANIWVATSGNVAKLRASDGAFLGGFPVGSGPFRVAFDGTNIWVTNASSNNVTRLMPAFPQP